MTPKETPCGLLGRAAALPARSRTTRTKTARRRPPSTALKRQKTRRARNANSGSNGRPVAEVRSLRLSRPRSLGEAAGGCAKEPCREKSGASRGTRFTENCRRQTSYAETTGTRRAQESPSGRRRAKARRTVATDAGTGSGARARTACPTARALLASPTAAPRAAQVCSRGREAARRAPAAKASKGLRRFARAATQSPTETEARKPI